MSSLGIIDRFTIQIIIQFNVRSMLEHLLQHLFALIILRIEIHLKNQNAFLTIPNQSNYDTITPAHLGFIHKSELDDRCIRRTHHQGSHLHLRVRFFESVTLDLCQQLSSRPRPRVKRCESECFSRVLVSNERRAVHLRLNFISTVFTNLISCIDRSLVIFSDILFCSSNR